MKPLQRIMRAVLLGVACISMHGLPAAAQQQPVQRRRVQFERNRTSTVIKNQLRRGTTHQYTLRAGAGQTMSVHLVARQTSFNIYPPGGGAPLEDAYGVSDWQGPLPETGEYTIELATAARVAPYTLEITIR